MPAPVYFQTNVIHVWLMLASGKPSRVERRQWEGRRRGGLADRLAKCWPTAHPTHVITVWRLPASAIHTTPLHLLWRSCYPQGARLLAGWLAHVTADWWPVNFNSLSATSVFRQPPNHGTLYNSCCYIGFHGRTHLASSAPSAAPSLPLPALLEKGVVTGERASVS